MARNHVPHQVNSIEMEHNRYMTNVSDTNSLEYRRSQAKLLQQSKKYSEAIDAYLAIDSSICSDRKELATMYETAFSLAKKFVRARKAEVALKVGGRLVRDCNMHQKAATVYGDAGNHKATVESLMAGKMYDQARKHAKKYIPSMAKSVDAKHQRHLAAGLQARPSYGD